MGWSFGDRFNSYIRPSNVKLRSKGPLLGHVVDSRFLVHFNSLQVKLKNGGDLWEVDDPLRKFKIGDRVYLQFDEDKVMLLKKYRAKLGISNKQHLFDQKMI